MYQSGRAGDEAKKRKSPAKSGRVGITGVIFIKDLLGVGNFSVAEFSINSNCNC